ncbi:MAG: PmoA family protein, partial [Actinobacteria bacterium]|nr:PmoA family protein [Actinomycetota bacterium]
MVTLTDDGASVRACGPAGDGPAAGLMRYVYRPGEAQLESPRPYFHPVRTLRGGVVSLYR